jgi:adenylosuccinate lyase
MNPDEVAQRHWQEQREKSHHEIWQDQNRLQVWREPEPLLVIAEAAVNELMDNGVREALREL